MASEIPPVYLNDSPEQVKRKMKKIADYLRDNPDGQSRAKARFVNG